MGSVGNRGKRTLEIKKGIPRGRNSTSKVMEMVMTEHIHFYSVLGNARNILGNIVIKVSVRLKGGVKIPKEGRLVGKTLILGRYIFH